MKKERGKAGFPSPSNNFPFLRGRKESLRIQQNECRLPMTSFYNVWQGTQVSPFSLLTWLFQAPRVDCRDSETDFSWDSFLEKSRPALCKQSWQHLDSQGLIRDPEVYTCALVRSHPSTGEALEKPIPDPSGCHEEALYGATWGQFLSAVFTVALGSRSWHLCTS